MDPADQWTGPPTVWLGVPDDGSTWVTLDPPSFVLVVGSAFSLSLGTHRDPRDQVAYTIPHPRTPERRLILAIQGGVERLTDLAIDWPAHFALRAGPTTESGCESGWAVRPLEVTASEIRDHMCLGPDWIRLGDSGATFDLQAVLQRTDGGAPDTWVDLVIR